MSEKFSSLLRTARLTSLNKPLEGVTNAASQKIPTLQIIETTPASFHRRDWGLKAPIPSKHRSLYVNVSALDSMEGLAQYEAGSGDYRRLQRFREMGQPIQLWNQGANRKHSYFEAASTDSSNTLSSLSEAKREKLLNRVGGKWKEFEQFLLSKTPGEGARQSDLWRSRADKTKFIEEFCGLSSSSRINEVKQRTGIGLNYGLKGALHNTPKGVVTHKIIKGRQVLLTSKQTAPAVGGFITESAMKRLPEKITETQNYYVQRVESDVTGAIKINARQFDNKSASGSRYSVFS